MSGTQLAIVATVLGIHLLFFFTLQARQAVRSTVAQRLTVWLALPPLPPPKPVPPEAVPPTRIRKSSSPPVVRHDRATLDAPPARQTPLLPPIPEQRDALAPEPAVRADVLSRALRDIGNIDQALRREFPAFPTAPPVSIQSRLEKATALAARHNGRAPGIEERQMPDGRRISRVTTSSGSYCVMQKGAGANDGIDHLANGTRLQVTSCGNLFD